VTQRQPQFESLFSMIKSLRTDRSEFTQKMKEEFKHNKVHAFEKELRETLNHYDEILKHKKDL
jgi:hypothetical protein